MDVSGEKREREQYYEKILHEYKDRKNNLGAFKESQAQKISQMYAKDTSSFNMDLAKQKVRLTHISLIIIIIEGVMFIVGSSKI